MRRNISKKIIINTLAIVLLLAAILVSVMSFYMKNLTDTIMQDVLPSTIKTTSQSIEGSIHMLADRIFMIGDNEFLTNINSSKKEKQAVLDMAQSGIEFVWLGLYDEEGKLLFGNEKCPSSEPCHR